MCHRDFLDFVFFSGFLVAAGIFRRERALGGFALAARASPVAIVYLRVERFFGFLLDLIARFFF
jgi:hypothetical protein